MPTIECPCCDGCGAHITGYCGDGCCAYTEWCTVCHGEGDITLERLAEVEASERDVCDYGDM